MSSTISTLEEVANQFQVWRDNKKNSKFSPIPIYLKNHARQLLSSYPISQVAAALSVSRSFLYNIQKDQNYSLDSKNQQTSGTESLNFIPFNFVDPNQPQKNQLINPAPPLNFTCEMIKPNGIRLIIHTSDPTSIINTFLCSN
ncbi:MAG: hypothetical protein EBQ62_03575 [Alphaproteobacteria bacterium]|nr:hypothetical protein [Alphaproteobacteria bacterium]